MESNALFASESVNVEMSGDAHLHVLMSKTANPQNSGAFLETMENLLDIAIYIQIWMDMDQCQPV